MQFGVRFLCAESHQHARPQAEEARENLDKKMWASNKGKMAPKKILCCLFFFCFSVFLIEIDFVHKAFSLSSNSYSTPVIWWESRILRNRESLLSAWKSNLSGCQQPHWITREQEHPSWGSNQYKAFLVLGFWWEHGDGWHFISGSCWFILQSSSTGPQSQLGTIAFISRFCKYRS